MPNFDLTGELSLKIELHMFRPITEKVHSGNGPVSLVQISIGSNSTSLPKGLSDIVIPSTARGRSQSLFSFQFDIFQIVGITNY